MLRTTTTAATSRRNASGAVSHDTAPDRKHARLASQTTPLPHRPGSLSRDLFADASPETRRVCLLGCCRFGWTDKTHSPQPAHIVNQPPTAPASTPVQGPTPPGPNE